MKITISLGDLTHPSVITLLKAHLADMYATSPPQSVHALDLSKLQQPDITFWCAKNTNNILGCIALKEIDKTHGEIKSMRTNEAARGNGVATALLQHVLNEAKNRAYSRLSLETGSQSFFHPARNLYQKHGFSYCEPFADYQADENSVFMSKQLAV